LGNASTPEGQKWLIENSQRPGVVTLKSGLQYKVIKSGGPDGKVPNASSPCLCHYRGTLIDGREFDSSYKRGPTTFAPNQVIKGWTEAMQLMHEGDKWELYVPSELAYGNSQRGSLISPGSVLVFELEILEVKEARWYDFLFNQQFMMIGGFLAIMAFQSFFADAPANVGSEISLSKASSAEGNCTVYFDVEAGGEHLGRIEFMLFSSSVPKTAENFRALCTGESQRTAQGGKKLHFKGSSFHRVIPGFMLQGGDFTAGNGTGGESIYGRTFEDEWTHGYIKHSEPFLLSMANAGKNTNGSQFFITVARTGHLDGKHVVFGKVTSGIEVVKQIESLGSGSGRTKKAIVIADCGIVHTREKAE